MWFDHKFIVQSQSCYQSGNIENVQPSEMDCLFLPEAGRSTYPLCSSSFFDFSNDLIRPLQKRGGKGERKGQALAQESTQGRRRAKT